MTACAGDLLCEYFALRDELACGEAAAGQSSDRYSGLIDSFLTRSEARLAAVLDTRTRLVGERLQRLELVLDWLVRFLAFYTLDMPVQYRDDAAAVAKQRYRNCVQFVEERLATARPVGPATVAREPAPSVSIPRRPIHSHTFLRQRPTAHHLGCTCQPRSLTRPRPMHTPS
jgi:hypothetical protein